MHAGTVCRLWQNSRRRGVFIIRSGQSRLAKHLDSLMDASSLSEEHPFSWELHHLLLLTQRRMKVHMSSGTAASRQHAASH